MDVGDVRDRIAELGGGMSFVAVVSKSSGRYLRITSGRSATT